MPARTLSEPSKWWQRVQDWEGEYRRECNWTDEVLANYRNKFHPGLLTVNLIFAYGRALLPQLYFKNPVVAVNIKQHGFEDLSRTIQLLDDALIEAMGLKEVIKRVILSAHLCGRGVAKVGWSDGDSYDQMPEFQNLSQTLGIEPSYPVWKMREMIAPGRPWIMDFATQDFAFDSSVKRLRDSAWFAMRFTKKAYEVRDDENIHLEPEKIPDDDDADLEFWEVWDKWTGKFRTIYENEWVTDEHDIRYWAFLTLDFNEALDSPFPVSDASLMLPQQKEINEIKTQIAEHRRLSVLKILARKNALSPADKSRLERGIVGALVEVEGQSLQDAIKEFTPTIPVELYTEANTVEQDIRAVIGFNRNANAEFSDTKKTALEAQIVQQALQLRLDERRDMVADWIKRGMVTVNDMVSDRWTAQQVMQWAGQSDGWDKLPQVKHLYIMKVVPDSTLPLSRMLAKQEANTMYGLFKDDQLIDPIWLREHILEQFESVDPKTALNPAAVAAIKQRQQMMMQNQQQQTMPNMPQFPIGQVVPNGNGAGAVQ